jgi:hypothetical protein
MSLQKMKAILRHNGYEIYSRPFELNIVGLRSKSVIPNRFDDEIHVFYKISKSQWVYHVFKATTDPGTYWLKQPMQPQGTAILDQGQYKGAYKLGLHKGQYLALVQAKPVNFIRDYNRDAVLDFNNGNKMSGMIGIDIHRANVQGETKYVDRNSAGCQVFENASDFALFLKLCEKHRQLYGNSFTYSLIDFRAVQRQNIRYVLSGIGALGMIGAGFIAIKHKEKIKSVAQEVGDFFSDLIQAKRENENQHQTNYNTTPAG